jgi:hypothetical protein
MYFLRRQATVAPLGPPPMMATSHFIGVLWGEGYLKVVGAAQVERWAGFGFWGIVKVKGWVFG